MLCVCCCLLLLVVVVCVLLFVVVSCCCLSVAVCWLLVAVLVVCFFLVVICGWSLANCLSVEDPDELTVSHLLVCWWFVHQQLVIIVGFCNRNKNDDHSCYNCYCDQQQTINNQLKLQRSPGPGLAFEDNLVTCPRT